jgi:hypothetical protein
LVHRLEGNQYRLHGQFTRSQQATSALLEGFVVDVAALFAATDDVPDERNQIRKPAMFFAQPPSAMDHLT